MSARSSSEEFFIGRQPILDRDNKLVAYELLFRNGGSDASGMPDHVSATASVVSRAFADFGIEAALGPHKGFINCDDLLLRSDMLEALPADKIVLEILETVTITPEIVTRCSELKARGFTLALDDFADFEDRFLPLLRLAEIVKVDLLTLDDEALVKTTRKLQQWPLKLLAEKVDSEAQAVRCRDLGYDLFQGYYFAKPAIIAGKKLKQSELALIRLLGLVLEDADNHALESVLKQEPALTMALLRLTNSAATGAKVRIGSLRQAIDVLGRRQLQRWLQLLLYAAPAGGNQMHALMQLAAQRGRLMELLAGRMRPGERAFEDHAFMTGILSLLPAVMNVPLAEILRGIRLDATVRAALDDSSGELGALLRLTEALEGMTDAQCAATAAALPGLNGDTVSACFVEALAWSNSVAN